MEEKIYIAYGSNLNLKQIFIVGREIDNRK